MIPWPAIIVDMLPGCEFTCIAEKNAPHFRQLATQNFNSYSSSYNVKSYTNFGLTMNEQKIAIQKFQNKFVPGVHLKHSFFSLSLSLGDLTSPMLIIHGCLKRLFINFLTKCHILLHKKLETQCK